MKKLVIFIIMILLIIGGITILTNFVANKFDEKNKSLKEFVGGQIILKSDTLLVIDYSFINNTITLEDNREISGDFAKKLETLKNE